MTDDLRTIRHKAELQKRKTQARSKTVEEVKGWWEKQQAEGGLANLIERLVRPTR